MPRRELAPISFGGVGLSTTGRTAFFDFDEGGYNTPERARVALERIGKFPSHIRVQPKGKVFPLRITISSKDSEGQFEEISKIFNPDDGLQRLIVRDADDRDKRVQCVPQRIILDKDNDKSLTILLWAPEPFLEYETLISLTGNLSASPVILTTFNIGTANALPILTTTAQAAKLASEGWIRMREIAYANRSEFPLSGPGSGTWLLELVGGWDTASLVSGGTMQSDGRDIAVFVDEVKIPDEKVNLADMNTANTKVWIEITDGPAVSAALINTVAAGTVVFGFADATHGFKVGDYLTWVNDAAAVETARVSQVDDVQTTVTVTRGVRNTTAGASAIGTIIYRSGHHIQIAYNRTGLSARPTNPDIPLINLSTSTNEEWHWTTYPVWPDRNRRAGGFRRILYDGRDDVPELRKNRLSAKTALDFTGSDVRFTDIEPTADRPNFDAIEFNAPCGIRAAVGGIEYDASVGWPFCLQIIGRDLLGLDTIVFNRLGHELGLGAHFPPAPLYTNRQETPSNILSTVIFRARNIIVTSVRSGDGNIEVLAEVITTGHDLQKFVLDEETQIIGVVIRARNDIAGTKQIDVQLNEVGLAVVGVGGGPGAVLLGPIIPATLTGAFAEVCFFTDASSFTTDIPTFAPGEYFIALNAQSGGTGVVQTVRSNSSIYPKGEHWEYDGVDYIRFPAEDLWFAIISIAADNQEDVLTQARSGEDLLINDIDLLFDNVTPRTPIVSARSEEDAYYYNTTWEGANPLATRQVILSFLKRSADALGNSVTIDVAARTVTDDENGDDIRQTISVPGDPWINIIPESNTLSILGSAQNEDLLVTFRSTWQA